jgi:uncharacterized protein YkwD
LSARRLHPSCIDLCRALLLAAAFLASATAGALTLRDVNAVRGACPSGERSPLLAVSALDQVAADVAAGTALEDALADAGYHASEALALPVTALGAEHGPPVVLRARYCHELSRPDLSDAGMAERDGQLWLIVAAPLRVPAADDAEAIRAEVLALVNAARSKPRQCGERRYEAAAPLELSDQLTAAALVHARTMARTGNFEHVDDAGQSPSDRVRATRFRARLVGENIAAGMTSAAEAVQGWLDSPDHCENVMDARFTHLGAAFATNLTRDPAVYWTLDLAATREPARPAQLAVNNPGTARPAPTITLADRRD